MRGNNPRLVRSLPPHIRNGCGLIGLILAWSLFGNFGLAVADHSSIDHHPIQAGIQDTTVASVSVVGTPSFSIAWSRDSSLLATYSEFGNRVTVMQPNGRVMQNVERYGDHFSGRALAFVGDTLLIMRPLSADDGNSAFSVVDLQSGKPVASIPGPNPGMGREANWARAIAVSPDGSHLAVLAGPVQQTVLRVFTTTNWSMVTEISLRSIGLSSLSIISSITYSSDGSRLAVASANDVALFDTNALRNVTLLAPFTFAEDGCCVSSISFGNRSTNLLVSSSSFSADACEKGCLIADKCCRVSPPIHRLRLFNLASSTWTDCTAERPESIWDASSRDQDGLIAVASTTSTRLNNACTRDVYESKPGGESLRFSPNGRYLAFSGRETMTVLRVAP